MDLSRLKQINEQKASEAVSQKRHNELLLDNTTTQEVFVKSISKLVEFLDRKVTKTEVINQLRQIGTPDVDKVVTAVDSLHTTLKTHENTDLSEVTKILSRVLEEVKNIPKDKVEIPKQEQISYVAQLNELAKTVKAVEEAVKAQKLSVETPVVNVEAPVVKVDKPDLKPIEKSVSEGSKEVVKAVKGIKLPELNTDPIEKLLKKTNKLLEELPEYMPSSSGGGSSWVAVNEDGIPVPVELNNSAVVTTDVALATRLDDTADPVIYIGKASVGSAESSAVWQIAKLDTSSGLVKTWAGNAAFTQVWDDRASLTYS